MFVDDVGMQFTRNVDGVRSVAPADAAECGAVLRRCGEAGLTVMPAGGGTKLDWGSPVRADVMLETRRMAGVYAHSPGDLTAVVGAGTAWAAMQAALAEHRQMVALDPLWPEQATVGGVVAVNDSGARRGRYGSLRDLVIGLTVVLADGTVARSGGKVVKNVAGYDLHKLMIGAYGTLGVVTEVVFRLHPAGAGQSWTTTGTEQEVRAALSAVHKSSGSIEALQTRRAGDEYCLDLCCASLPRGVAGREADAAVWSARERLFQAAIVVKITVPQAQVLTVMSWVPRTTPAVAQGCILTAGLATMGGVADLRARVEAIGGALTIVRGDAGSENRWGAAPPAMALMHQVKRLFDPKRTLNPGRYVGGI